MYKSESNTSCTQLDCSVLKMFSQYLDKRSFSKNKVMTSLETLLAAKQKSILQYYKKIYT